MTCLRLSLQVPHPSFRRALLLVTMSELKTGNISSSATLGSRAFAISGQRSSGLSGDAVGLNDSMAQAFCLHRGKWTTTAGTAIHDVSVVGWVMAQSLLPIHKRLGRFARILSLLSRRHSKNLTVGSR